MYLPSSRNKKGKKLFFIVAAVEIGLFQSDTFVCLYFITGSCYDPNTNKIGEQSEDDTEENEESDYRKNNNKSAKHLYLVLWLHKNLFRTPIWLFKAVKYANLNQYPHSTVDKLLHKKNFPKQAISLFLQKNILYQWHQKEQKKMNYELKPYSLYLVTLNALV